MKKKKIKKEENPKVKKIKKIIIIVLLVYVAVNRIYGLFITNETLTSDLINLVTEEYEFVRVSECLSKYMDAINSQNANDIIYMYTDNYRVENNITAENVLSINRLSNVLYFKIEQLYKGDTHYYAWITFYNQKDELNIEKIKSEFTIQFYKNNTFSITPRIQENIVQGD